MATYEENLEMFERMKDYLNTKTEKSYYSNMSNLKKIYHQAKTEICRRYQREISKLVNKQKKELDDFGKKWENERSKMDSNPKSSKNELLKTALILKNAGKDEAAQQLIKTASSKASKILQYAEIDRRFNKYLDLMLSRQRDECNLLIVNIRTEWEELTKEVIYRTRQIRSDRAFSHVDSQRILLQTIANQDMDADDQIRLIKHYSPRKQFDPRQDFPLSPSKSQLEKFDTSPYETPKKYKDHVENDISPIRKAPKSSKNVPDEILSKIKTNENIISNNSSRSFRESFLSDKGIRSTILEKGITKKKDHPHSVFDHVDKRSRNTAVLSKTKSKLVKSNTSDSKEKKIRNSISSTNERTNTQRESDYDEEQPSRDVELIKTELDDHESHSEHSQKGSTVSKSSAKKSVTEYPEESETKKQKSTLSKSQKSSQNSNSGASVSLELENKNNGHSESIEASLELKKHQKLNDQKTEITSQSIKSVSSVRTSASIRAVDTNNNDNNNQNDDNLYEEDIEEEDYETEVALETDRHLEKMDSEEKSLQSAKQQMSSTENEIKILKQFIGEDYDDIELEIIEDDD